MGLNLVSGSYKQFFSLKTNMTWGKLAVFAAVNFFLAELVWRFCRVLHEWVFYPKHYPYKNKFQTIFKYGFTFDPWVLYFLVLLMAVILIQYPSLREVSEGVFELWPLLVIWWVYRCVDITRSTFDYADWIRSDSGLDYATGMASNYFHGYLKLTLPHDSGQEGIVKRIENYENKHGVEFAVKRLMILIPNSLHTRPVIKSDLMERQDGQPLKVVRTDRAGVSRPYTNDVYRLLIDGHPYYVSVEGATPLLSYFDALNFSLTSTWQMREMQKEIMVKFYRYLKNILEKWPATQEQCELVFYNDYTADGRPQDVGEVLCQHIKQMWAKRALEKSNDLDIDTI